MQLLLLMERLLPLTDARLVLPPISLQVLMRHHARLKYARQVNTRLRRQRQQIPRNARLAEQVSTLEEVHTHHARQAIARQVQLLTKLKLQARQIAQFVLKALSRSEVHLHHARQ